jgi:plasmid stabilization system protein ParE
MGNATRKRLGVRKLVHTPILVYYQVHEEKRLIEVLHFRHGSRRPPKL